MLPLLLVLPALAGEWVDPFTEPDEASAFQVEERLVTVASRYAQTARQAPNIVTVITDREIRERGYRTLADLLRDIPGIYLSRSPEGFTLAWFRGVIAPDNDKFLLLVDGVPWYDGIYTHAWIDEYVPLENVKQVEVIKGPGSALYGTNAFAGVVNVVTYGADDLQGGFVRAVAGSWASRGAAFVMGDRLERPSGEPVGVTGLVRYFETDGDGLDTVPKGLRNVLGTAPRRAVNAGLHLSVGGLSLALDAVDYRHTYWTQPEDDALEVLTQLVDGFNLSYRDTFASARYQWKPSRFFQLQPYAYVQHWDNPGDYAWFSDPVVEEDEDGELSCSWSTTLVETEKETLRWGAGVGLQARPVAGHVLVAGVGTHMNHVLALEDRTFTDRATEPDEGGFRMDPHLHPVLSDYFAYVQDSWSALYWLELTAGARLDVHSVSGLFPSPRAGILLVPTSHTTLKLLYGRAFRAPTARELLVVVDQDEEGHNKWTAGNPDLQPERIDTLEAELLQDPLPWLHLRASVFSSAISDEIDKSNPARPDPRLGDAYYDNFEGSDVLGAELGLRLERGPLEGKLSYTWTHAVDRQTGYLQYGFPPQMLQGRLTARWDWGLRASLLGELYGPQPRADWSPDAGLDDGPAYGLLHAALATSLTADGRIRADVSVHNLLDTDYATLVYRDDANALASDGSAKYPVDMEGPGRSLLVGLEGEF